MTEPVIDRVLLALIKKSIGTGLTYRELLQSVEPRIITSDAELDYFISIIHLIIDLPNPSKDEEDLRFLIGLLIERYEEEHHPIPDLRGFELLKAIFIEWWYK